MKVILLKDVAKLGHKYEVKDVKSGHALNLLIPKGEAIPATRSAMNNLKVQKEKAEGERKVHNDLIVMNLKGLDGYVLNVVGKANDKGHLFAGLHKEAIVAELQKQSELQIDPAFIQLEHPVKEVGEHEIEVKAEGKSVKFKLVVSAA
ncbi:MAG: 50S ribosomal protein L9 [Candidatus Taylorbacteria bacterium]|nr:50S ribosomal protein L9 [Candidatus Taylorbacteria bacterium]